jgi:hypothetical protein
VSLEFGELYCYQVVVRVGEVCQCTRLLFRRFDVDEGRMSKERKAALFKGGVLGGSDGLRGFLRLESQFWSHWTRIIGIEYSWRKILSKRIKRITSQHDEPNSARVM